MRLSSLAGIRRDYGKFDVLMDKDILCKFFTRPLSDVGLVRLAALCTMHAYIGREPCWCYVRRAPSDIRDTVVPLGVGQSRRSELPRLDTMQLCNNSPGSCVCYDDCFQKKKDQLNKLLTCLGLAALPAVRVW